MRCALFVVLIVSSSCSEEANQVETPLGTSADAVRQVGLSPGQLTFENGEIHCAAGNIGYWATPRAYRNYRLHLEFRFVRPPDLVDDSSFTGNSGYMLHMTGDTRPFPESIEVQGQNIDVAHIFAIAGAPAVTDAIDDPDARKQFRRPVGEWNVVDIDSIDGELRSFLNGVHIASAATVLREGPIGFQCEGAEIHWRDVRITTLDFGR